jgi:hypothetical protein
MGGNAIAKARRVTKEEYDAIIKHIEGQSYHVNSNEVYRRRHVWIAGQVVKSYRQKQDFGDIDVVIDDRVDIVDIFAHYRPKKCAVNGNVMSIAYDSIQVDFIRTPKEYIQSTLDYFAYNDLGNLLGKIARAIGMKYGSKGLIYQHKQGNNVIEDIVVTKDITEILTHLGLDPSRYHQGFDELEDIFKYVASSKWFDKHLYKPENSSQENRVRDAKRKTYLAFLEWMKGLPDWIHHLPVLTCTEYENVIAQYPHVGMRIKAIDAERKQEKLFRELINGAVISELTGLTGTELGQFIERFRQLHTKDEILKLTGPEVRKLITDTFKFFKHKEKENG